MDIRRIIINLLMTTALSSFICAEDRPIFFQPFYISNRSLLENLWEKSPFERKVTPSSENAAASSYVMTGFGEIGDKRYISIYNTNTKERLMLSEESQNGARLVDFKSDTDAAKTTAIIEINGESFLTKFDSSIVSAPPPSSQPSPTPANPPRPPNHPFPPTFPQSTPPSATPDQPFYPRNPRRFHRNPNIQNSPQ